MTVPAATVNQYYTGIFRQAPSTAVSAAYQAMPTANDALNSMLSAANVQVDPVVRLYQTAFNRVPDSPGMTAWVVPFSTGQITLQQIANGFTQSTEFTTLYPTTLSNAQYVGALYWNILQRAGEDSGIQGWVNALNSGALTRAQVLLGFSESQEFKANIEPNVNAFLTNCANNTETYTGSLFDQGGAPAPGDIYVLTPNVDIATAQYFDGSQNSFGRQTLNPGDQLTGRAQTGNELDAQISQSVTPALLKNIQTITVENTGALNPASIGLANATGVLTVNNRGSASEMIFNNVAATVATVGVLNTNAATTVNYTSTTGSQTVNLNLSGAGADGTDAIVTMAGIEVVNVTSDVAKNYVDLELSAATTLNFSGSQDLAVATLATGGKTIYVSNVDAASMTGALTIALGAQAGVNAGTVVSVTGGSGNDSLTVTDVTQNVSVLGGAGNDTIVSTTIDTSDTVDGGEGIDALSTDTTDAVALAATAPTTYKITNIEQLTISDQFDDGGTALTVANIATSIDTLNLKNDAAAALTAGVESVVGGAGDFTINLGKAKSTNTTTGLANTLTVTDTGTGTDDTLTIANTYTKSADGTSVNVLAGKDVTVNGYEALVVKTGGASQTVGTLTMTPDDLNLGVSLTASGSGGLTVTSLSTSARGLLAVDGSGLAAQPNNGNTLVLTIGAQGVGGTASVIGSAGKDTILQGVAFATTIDGGAGNDAITGNTKADSLLGGAGNDTVESGGGNDTMLGGEGNDTLTLTAAGTKASLDGGAGNDTLDVGNFLGKTQVLAGGEGTDAFKLSNTSLTNWNGYTTDEKAALKTNITAIETVEVSDTTAQSIDVSKMVNTAEVTKLQFDAAVTGGASWTKLASGMTAEYRAAGNTQTLAVAGSSSADVLNIKLNANVAAGTDFGTLTTTGVETVNIDSTTRQDTKSSATNTVAISDADLTGSTITGASNTVLTYTAAVDLATIDASATTGTLNITATSATVGTTVTAGTGAMTVASGSGADVINGGGGNDSIASNSGADTILAGDGDDTIDGGAASDSIDAGDNDDIIITSSGADTIDGGEGTDTLSVAALYKNLTTMTISNVENLDLNSNQATLSIAQYAGFTTFADITEGVKFSDAGTATANTTNLAKYVLANGANTITANGNLAYNISGAAATTAAQTFKFAGQYLTNDDTIVGGGGTSDYLYVTGNQAVNTAPAGVVATSSNIDAVEYIVFDNTNTNITLAAFDAVATSGTLTIDATAQASGNTSITTAAAGSGQQDYNILLSAGTNTINAGTIVNSSELTVVGGVGNDSVTVKSGTGIDYIDFSAGGVDSVTGITGTASADIVVSGTTGTVTIGVSDDWTATSATTSYGASVTVNAVATAANIISLASASISGTNGFTINGEAATASTITGSSGFDNITGGSGGDVITGGAGSDEMVGNNGADTFVFGTLSGTDAIYLGDATGGTDGSADLVYYSFATAASLPSVGVKTVYGFETGTDVIQFTQGLQRGAGGASTTGTGGFATVTAGSFNSVTAFQTAATDKYFWEIDGTGNVTVGTDANQAWAAIAGNSTAVVATNAVTTDKLLFIVDDGSDSYLWSFVSTDITASVGDISLIGVIDGVNDLQAGDFKIV